MRSTTRPKPICGCGSRCGRRRWTRLRIRPRRSALAPALAGATLLVSGGAEAHGFGRLYTLPVPFWLYAWGAAAVLIVSFFIAALFVARPAESAGAREREVADARWLTLLRRAQPVLRILSVLLLVLCLATGWLGVRDPYRNFNMTFFWIAVVLGLTYLTAFVGDVYAQLNPWRAIVDGVARIAPAFTRGRVDYPQRLGYWPAFALYYAFIAFELFGHSHPASLANALLVYALINLAGTWLFGAANWFRFGEFFSVFFRLVALVAPLEWRAGVLRVRPMFSALSRARAADLSEITFLLFMLSSTAFDGLRATQPWVMSFWNSAWLRDRIGRAPITAYAELHGWFDAIEYAALALSPFIYLGAYLLALTLAKALTRSERPLRELARDFVCTLLPIVLVYNVTHYFTLLLSHGPKLVALVSDPFGWGWNLFGTATYGAPFLPGMAWVWHLQVALILFGHIVSVVLAHRVAQRVFPSRRNATLSQLPVLLLMVLFTVAGLWILAQPMQTVISM